MKNLNFIKLNNKDIKKLKLIRNGDMGSTAKIYGLTDTECIKIFNKAKSEFDFYNFNIFTDFDYDFVVSPKKLVVNNNFQFIGYTMEFINGNTINQLDDFDFSNFLKLYKILLDKAMSELTEDGIKICDCSSSNIIYDQNNNCFKLIDIDKWVRYTFKKEDLMSYNYHNLLDTLKSCIFGMLTASIFEHNIDRETDLIDYFETLRDNAEKKNHVIIKTLRDSKKYI